MAPVCWRYLTVFVIPTPEHAIGSYCKRVHTFVIYAFKINFEIKFNLLHILSKGFPTKILYVFLVSSEQYRD